MLDLARRTVMPSANHIELLEGTVDQAPAGPFDGACCLLTLHHLDRGERLRTLREIRRRLNPGARLMVANHTAPGSEPGRRMTRSVAFGNRSGIDWVRAAQSGDTMVEPLPLLSPAEEEALLGEAGFEDVALFYAAFSFRGWVGTAGR